MSQLSVKNPQNEAQPDTRQRMKHFWKYHSQSEINNSLMMLIEPDHAFEYKERKEILSYLPNCRNLNILELGAGIGRFSGEFAKGKLAYM